MFVEVGVERLVLFPTTFSPSDLKSLLRRFRELKLPPLAEWMGVVEMERRGKRVDGFEGFEMQRRHWLDEVAMRKMWGDSMAEGIS